MLSALALACVWFAHSMAHISTAAAVAGSPGAESWTAGSGLNEASLAVEPQAQLALVENHGQWDGAMRYVGRIGSTYVRLEPDAIALQQHVGPDQGVLVRLAFEEATGSPVLEGVEPSPGLRHYYIGSDPAGWHTRVPAWKSVAYRNAWVGVDVVIHGQGGAAKYDLLIETDADLDRVVFRVEGAQALELDANGALRIVTELGVLHQPAPVSYQQAEDGRRIPVAVRYRLLDGMRYGFESDARSPGASLVVDPGLIWSTYIGSASIGTGDKAWAVCLGPNGEAIVAGHTDGPNFPVTPGAFSTNYVPADFGFATVFDASGSTLIYSSVFGGIEPDYTQAHEVAMTAEGQVVVAGFTMSDGFPTTFGAFDQFKNSFNQSGFVMKFTPDGGDLVFSTLLEGSQSESIHALVIAPDGGVIVGGQSASSNFPVTPAAFDKTHGPGIPAFVTKFDPSGSQLLWSTFLNGGGNVHALCLGEDGSIFATGITGLNFPATPGSFNPVGGGASWEGFIAKLSSNGSQLLWGTYLGGYFDDQPKAIAYHPAAGVVVTGRTDSPDFPVTPSAFQPTQHPLGSYEMFVTRLNATGSALVYSTYLGMSGTDEALGVAMDAAGVVTIAGVGGWNDFPTTTGAYDKLASSSEGVLARFSPDGSRLFYCTFLGTGGAEQLTALACDAYGIATAVGWSSGGYPTTPGCYSPLPAGGQTDGVVTRMDLLPLGAQIYGTSTPACHGPIAIGVTEMPAAGSTSFGIYASGAPPGAIGVLGLGVAALGAGVPFGEALLWVNPGLAPSLSTVLVPATPFVEKTIAIPAGTAGLRAFAQFMFVNPAGCGTPGALSASNALILTVQ
jgi:hypothetical protein